MLLGRPVLAGTAGRSMSEIITPLPAGSARRPFGGIILCDALAPVRPCVDFMHGRAQLLVVERQGVVPLEEGVIVVRRLHVVGPVLSRPIHHSNAAISLSPASCDSCGPI